MRGSTFNKIGVQSHIYYIHMNVCTYIQITIGIDYLQLVSNVIITITITNIGIQDKKF